MELIGLLLAPLNSQMNSNYAIDGYVFFAQQTQIPLHPSIDCLVVFELMKLIGGGERD